MNDPQHIFQPATILHINAICTSGEQTFFLQGGDEDNLVTLLIEKVQIQMIAVGAVRIIDEIEADQTEDEKSRWDYDEAEMEWLLPVDPLFRVGEIALGYDKEKDLLLLQVAEGRADEERQQVMFWVAREKMRGLAHWALELASRGRSDAPCSPVRMAETASTAATTVINPDFALLPLMEGQTILSVLEKGEVKLRGRFLESSNTTLFVTCLLEEEFLQAVYKPESGQSKLYDFEPATLPRREVAAWLVCRAAGWDFVPPAIN